MGTTYVGSKTATNDPNGKPEPNRSPAATIPLDGDGDEASTHQPGEKAQMDWADWLRAPVAKLVEYANGAIKRYRNAKGFSRWGIDHTGYPAGRFIYSRDHWPFTINQATDTSGVIVVPNAAEWEQIVEDNGGNVGSIVVGDGTAITGRVAIISPGATIGSRAAIGKVLQTVFGEDASLVMEFNAELNSGANNEHRGGIWNGVIGSAAPVGLYFEATDSDANILARASGALAFDTGIAKGATLRRFRIEFYGLNVDENGTPARRAVFYIDGAKVAEITGFATVIATSKAGPVFSANNTTGAGVVGLRVRGAVLFGANTHAGDVF